MRVAVGGCGVTVGGTGVMVGGAVVAVGLLVGTVWRIDPGFGIAQAGTAAETAKAIHSVRAPTRAIRVMSLLLAIADSEPLVNAQARFERNCAIAPGPRPGACLTDSEAFGERESYL